VLVSRAEETSACALAYLHAVLTAVQYEEGGGGQHQVVLLHEVLRRPKYSEYLLTVH
jgi:hypothetical protein